jgi:crotonobetainyl-CoA:carnitine CoA-transferase CaiB-like acyl-CoA transferase
VRNEHARATRSVISLDDPGYGLTHQMGYPVSLSQTPPQVRGPRRARDADRAAILAELNAPPGQNGARAGAPSGLHAALDGFHAIGLTELLAGPTACRILAEYGADVVQITNPNARAGRDFHLSVDSGKRTMLLDLKKPGAMDVFWALIDNADVVSTELLIGGRYAPGGR